MGPRPVPVLVGHELLPWLCIPSSSSLCISSSLQTYYFGFKFLPFSVAWDFFLSSSMYMLIFMLYFIQNLPVCCSGAVEIHTGSFCELLDT